MSPRFGRSIFEHAREHHRGGRHGPFSELFREPPPRVDRGTVRYLILDALKDAARHGYEILQVIDQRSGGIYRPSPGVVYPTLQMLEEMGLLKLEQKGDRKVYALTAEGKAELAAHAEEVAAFYESSRDQSYDFGDDMHELAHRFRRLLHLFKRNLRRGGLTPTRAKAVRGVVNRAIAELEELLGEGQ